MRAASRNTRFITVGLREFLARDDLLSPALRGADGQPPGSRRDRYAGEGYRPQGRFFELMGSEEEGC